MSTENENIFDDPEFILRETAAYLIARNAKILSVLLNGLGQRIIYLEDPDFTKKAANEGKFFPIYAMYICEDGMFATATGLTEMHTINNYVEFQFAFDQKNMLFKPHYEFNQRTINISFI